MKKVILDKGSLRLSAYLYGEENSEHPLVICLHGFPDNANSFRFQIDDFLKAGFRVLCPTMRGYEESSAPESNNLGVAAIAQDIVDFLDLLNESKAHLVGHDWGAAIAYYLGASHSQRFKSLTTIAIANPGRFTQKGIPNVPSQLFKSWYMIFNQIPLLSDYVAKRNDFTFIKFLWRKWSPNFEISDEHWQDLSSTFSQPGVMKSMLSYYRQNVSILQILGLKRSPLNAQMSIGVPNLAITGADDGCMDTRIFDHALLPEDHPMGLQVERIEGVGHFAHQEKPEMLNSLMIKWFNSHRQ